MDGFKLNAVKIRITDVQLVLPYVTPSPTIFAIPVPNFGTSLETNPQN